MVCHFRFWPANDFSNEKHSFIGFQDHVPCIGLGLHSKDKHLPLTECSGVFGRARLCYHKEDATNLMNLDRGGSLGCYSLTTQFLMGSNKVCH